MNDDRPAALDAVATTADGARLVAGFVAVFVLFQWLGISLASDRGQAGLLIGAAVAFATLGAERLLFGRGLAAATIGLGLGAPRLRGLVVAAAVGVVLLSTLVVFATVTRTPMAMAPGWIASVPGLFAQAGIGEEILFRGYLFGHLRTSRSFWRAAALSMIPFVLVHMILFVTMPWPLALASVLLAAVISVPLAYLFELGGHTIWAPALLHAVIQGAVKVVIVPDDRTTPLALTWMLASAVVPLMILAVPPPRRRR